MGVPHSEVCKPPCLSFPAASQQFPPTCHTFTPAADSWPRLADPGSEREPRAELGKPMRNCYNLPGFDFSYGLYIERTDGGVPAAIGHWNTIKPRTNLTRNMPRDFITMNRGALKAGCTTARQFNLYYKAKDIRRKDDEYSRLRRSPPHVPADMTYGIPARSSTPLYDLLQHKYKELWMEQQRALTAALRLKETKWQQDKVRDNRASLLRKIPVPPKEESFWHLPHLDKQWDLDIFLNSSVHPIVLCGTCLSSASFVCGVKCWETSSEKLEGILERKEEEPGKRD
ncbi:cilia- and flagella-associated protein 77 isoform X3 [Numida meleagris]|uniref:cilia- and flagella-associated protein 77 isoform X3 n=1 Tax=Numida meleagris TaxID=8996 RepID=UPI000B3E400F|nr:cilia- and flagella-associated protein 77 isoform X3 [Numida meleagris]